VYCGRLHPRSCCFRSAELMDHNMSDNHSACWAGPGAPLRQQAG
jgi:hypothetical protein